MLEDPGNASAPPAISWPRRLLLVRHGQTSWNRERRFLGKTDVPLDAQGEAQAEALGALLGPGPGCPLPLDRIVSSPLRRAMATAQAIARPHGLPVERAGDLAELDQGELEGQEGRVLLERHPALLARWLRDPSHVRLPGGETLGECQRRAWAALRAILDAGPPGGAVAVVSHQMVIGALLCRVQGLPLRRIRDQAHEPTAFSLLEVEAGRLHLVSPPLRPHWPA